MVSIAVACVLLGLQVESASASSGSASNAAEPGNAKPIEVVRGHVASYPRVIQGRISSGNGKPVADALIEWGVCQLNQLLSAPPALQVRALADTDARAEFNA